MALARRGNTLVCGDLRQCRAGKGSAFLGVEDREAFLSGLQAWATRVGSQTLQRQPCPINALCTSPSSSSSSPSALPTLLLAHAFNLEEGKVAAGYEA